METAMNLALAPWFHRAWTTATVRRPAAAAGQPGQLLQRDATLVVDDPRGLTVTCVQGCLWLTHDGDCKDLVLAPGQCYQSARPGRLLVHALEPTRVRLLR
jgi:hypothetical protein